MLVSLRRGITPFEERDYTIVFEHPLLTGVAEFMDSLQELMAYAGARPPPPQVRDACICVFFLGGGGSKLF
jgi:hypothetical protein